MRGAGRIWFSCGKPIYVVRFAHGPLAPRMDGGIIDESERGVCSFSGKIGLSLYRYSWVSLITARHCTVTFETSWFVIRGSGRIWFSCGKPIYIVRCAHGPLALRGDRGRSDGNDGGVCSFSGKIGLSLYRYSWVSKSRHAPFATFSGFRGAGCGVDMVFLLKTNLYSALRAWASRPGVYFYFISQGSAEFFVLALH